MKHNNFGYLLLALLALLIGVPLLEDMTGWGGPTVRALAYTFVLTLGVWSLRESRGWFHIGLALAVAGILLNALDLSTVHDAAMFASLLFFFLFLSLCIFLVMREVVGGTEVNLNRIAGAVCVYLLLGFIWSVAYMVLFAVDAQAFTGLSETAAGQQFLDFQYYSFVTLTTLGYGDVLPISDTARALAIVESIVGQFYIAVLVAALVGAYVSNIRDKQG
jgi:hypothetical protein